MCGSSRQRGCEILSSSVRGRPARAASFRSVLSYMCLSSRAALPPRPRPTLHLVRLLVPPDDSAGCALRAAQRNADPAGGQSTISSKARTPEAAVRCLLTEWEMDRALVCGRCHKLVYFNPDARGDFGRGRTEVGVAHARAQVTSCNGKPLSPCAPIVPLKYLHGFF